MKTTEEAIVYQLLNTIRAAELNSDEVIGERKVRSLLRTHRAENIYLITKNGDQASDEYFQEVEVQLRKINEREWTGLIPHTIQLEHNFGTKFMTAGFQNVSIIPEEAYHNSKHNIVNKYLPFAKIENQELMLRIPEPSPYAMNNGSVAESLLSCITRNADKMILKLILADPDEGYLYNWTESAYPVPFESIQMLKEKLLKKEFNIIVNSKADQVPNSKNDTLRYHDQGKVQQ